jgi:transcriptional regulator with XRE-family HTH domain
MCYTKKETKGVRMMGENYSNLARLLRTLRKRSGLSQADVAQRLGITRSAYSYYESGKVLPNLVSIRKLAEVFQVPVTMIVYPEEYTSLE